MTMKTIPIAIVSLLSAMLALPPAAALAGPDSLQRQLLQQLEESQRKLEQARQASEAERLKLMQEHMSMMEESMKMMQAMRPRKGMTMEEHEEWIAQHQRIMDTMLEQMMKDQQMLMQMTK
jgi:hypothetical protein